MNHNLLVRSPKKTWWTVCTRFCQKFHFDPMLLLGILILSLLGLCMLYSAGNQSLPLLGRQLVNFIFAFFIMFICAQIPTNHYQHWVPWIFGLVLLMLLIVMNAGIISHGAQRWINLGLFHFQPAEAMKLTMPMMLAWYLRNKTFPLHLKDLFFSCLIIIVPFLLIAKQPDLGTALLVAATGGFVLLLAGITWRIIICIGAGAMAAMPVIWHLMHSYQKMRLLTFLSPENDPFGSGYNIIQSKIAIGSGGWLGKGWLHGSQVHLQFLPVRSTDFIFAVCGEEFGFIGCIVLIGLYIYIIGRSFYISANAQDTFSRLLAGSLTLSFFTSLFVNIGMVTGVLPVVGVPLPLISYGGSSLIIFLAGFGVIMSVQAHRRLIGS